MYNPPLTLEEIKEQNPEKFDVLRNEPVHYWRATSGIEHIHKESSREEQLRIWENWQEMSDEQKRVSDEKSETKRTKTSIVNYMREIERTIASALIMSKDDKLLMGRKDSSKGGVYSDCWHIPGGGVNENETLEQAVIREVLEEVGLDVSSRVLELVPNVGSGSSEKVLKTGEKVICNMKFNRFMIRFDDVLAKDISVKLNSDLVEYKWFTREELPFVKQIPGGKEFFQEIGLI
jgi:8-oxo-dGTP pyrophosphatase MutT (NUDIX family)